MSALGPFAAVADPPTTAIALRTKEWLLPEEQLVLDSFFLWKERIAAQRRPTRATERP
jgi:hypothetical protein